ncbi:uncharacterized protein LOC129179970 isoform X2 [Dunckerocampus dactyliophorus]|uniref:uncharacterized protein LOC129179970 isoform X2 n=1 Tax=Dunckerocampus dactyliophorus TaxID=161453 RepID=UPI002404B3CF|nr:uncharacterized protein LOC129179970 isoform X2 [Dunckerocampus dactyliophorus]
MASGEEELSRTRKEKEQQQQQQDGCTAYIVLHIQDDQLISQDERPTQQHGGSPTFKQENPQHPHFKEEEDESWATGPQGDCRLGKEVVYLHKLPLTGVSVKTEDHEDKSPESSRLHPEAKYGNDAQEPLSSDTDCEVSLKGAASQADQAKEKSPRGTFKLKDQEEEAMVIEWVQENRLLWDQKDRKYKRKNQKHCLGYEASHSHADGDDSGSNASQPTPARKRAKKAQFCLDVQEEQIMCNFLRENTILWDIKKTDYRRVDKKAKLWRNQAKAMEKTVKHLQGWFKSLRDTHTRLDKKKSGGGAPELTEREQWVKANFCFLKPVVRHRPEPVNSVKATIAAHSGDLEAAEAACADIVVDDDSTPSPVPSASSQGKGKRGQDDDPLLQSPQKRLHESGEILKGLTQPQPITATAAFANYVRDSLVSMSQRKFRKARSRINAILSELMDEESD